MLSVVTWSDGAADTSAAADDADAAELASADAEGAADGTLVEVHATNARVNTATRAIIIIFFNAISSFDYFL